MFKKIGKIVAVSVVGTFWTFLVACIMSDDVMPRETITAKVTGIDDKYNRVNTDKGSFTCRENVNQIFNDAANEEYTLVVQKSLFGLGATRVLNVSPVCQ